MLSLYLSMLETDEERETFASFYKDHQGRCLVAARAITQNHAWAEEAVHEAFLKMIRRKDTYFTDPRKRTGTQIVIMVKSAAIDLLRRENRLDHSLLENVEPIIPNDEPDAFRIAASKEELGRLQTHVSQLSEVNQTLYEMKYILGLSDGEIAESVGLSKNAVAIRIHRLTKGLVEAMRKEGYVHE